MNPVDTTSFPVTLTASQKEAVLGRLDMALDVLHELNDCFDDGTFLVGPRYKAELDQLRQLLDGGSISSDVVAELAKRVASLFAITDYLRAQTRNINVHVGMALDSLPRAVFVKYRECFDREFFELGLR